MKTVIITGANGNLGSAVTKKFLESGYKVIATVPGEDNRKDIPENPQLRVEAVNLTIEAETESFIAKILAEYGSIDAALMLVGGFAMGNIASTTGDALKKQFSLNFETAYYMSRPLFQHMMANNNGRLVYIGARPALEAEAGKNLIAYSLSKSMLFKLADFLNADARGKNVTATVVVPSTLDTELNRKSMPSVDPGNWVKPEQVADILEFIVSDKSSPIRESVIKVYNNA